MTTSPIIIGISGASASGKSLLANTIVRELGSDQVAVIAEDSYYKDLKHLPFEERAKTNFDHPDSLDHALMIEQLAALRAGEIVEIPTYNHAEHIRADATRTIGNHAIIIIEGILLFYEERLRELMNIRLFMDTALDICLVRRLKRDLLERERSIDSVIKQYSQTVRPMYFQFIEPCKRHADLIVPHGGENRIAIDMIKAKINELLIHHAAN